MKWLFTAFLAFAVQAGADDCLLVAYKGGKAGFVDSNGVVRIPIQFESAGSFSEGRAPIKQNGNWGFIDDKGTVRIAPKYSEVKNFEFSFAVVRPQSNWIAIDLAGNEIAQLGLEDVRPWNTNILSIGTSPTLRLVGLTNGNLIGEFQVVDHLFEGVAVACRSNRFGFVSGSGEPLGPFRYDESVAFSDGLGAVKRGARWGFVDKTGKEAIALQFEWVGEFSENLAGARKENKWGFIDKTGQWVIAPQFEQIRLGFSDNVAAVKRENKWGYIDKSGKWVLKPTYAGAWPFINGVAAVQTGQRCILIRKDGQRLGRETFSFYVDHVCGVIRMGEGTLFSGSAPYKKYVNYKGETVWENR